MNKIQLRYEEVLLSVVAIDGFSSVILYRYPLGPGTANN